MNSDINDELPTKKGYIFRSIGYTLLIYGNLYCYRNIDSIQFNLINYIAFLVLIGVYISTGHHNISIKNGLTQFIETQTVTLWHSNKNRLYSVPYAGLICVISTILLIQEVYSDYQIFIDIVFFVFFVMEFYRGLNARFQNHFLLNLIQRQIKGGL